MRKETDPKDPGYIKEQLLRLKIMPEELLETSEHVRKLGLQETLPEDTFCGLCSELYGRFDCNNKFLRLWNSKAELLGLRVIPPRLIDLEDFKWYSGNTEYPVKKPSGRDPSAQGLSKSFLAYNQIRNKWVPLEDYSSEEALYVSYRLDFCLFIADELQRLLEATND